MADQQTVVAAWDAIAAIAPLVGGGGITAMVVAYWSYRKAQAEGRPGEPDRAGGGISALLADSDSIEKLVLSIDRLALAADKSSLLIAEIKKHGFEKFDDFIDEFRKLRRVLEDSLPKD